MQNNVTELTQKLLRSLDSNYNVIDMPAVIEIISLLEKVAITKELLETTRLGKYVNQLRRNTTNDSLAKRAKDLVKKWRDMVLPDSNGQLQPTETPNQQPQPDEQQGKKRSAKEQLENATAFKRTKINGQMSELDFSDNSNSSFKDVLNAKQGLIKPVIVINSDSNSSIPDTKHEPLLEQQQPKKRGRKKGSKNHKNLIEEAETSFSNKLNVSRGNAKVKTTQELLADLHIRNAQGKPIEDLNERAAKLTERVSIIDQKLNANSNRYRNSQKKFGLRNHSDSVIESGTVLNSSLLNSETSAKIEKTANDDEIIVVDDVELEAKIEPKQEPEEPEEVKVVQKSFSIEEALALLPPIDFSVLDEPDPEPHCTCQLIENKTDFSTEDDEEVNLQHTFEFVEDADCPSKGFLEDKYNLDAETLDKRVQRLHAVDLDEVNGNFSVGECKGGPKLTDDGLYVNVVPNVYTENLPKSSSIDYVQPASENFKKYSISEKDEAAAPKDNFNISKCCNDDDGSSLLLQDVAKNCNDNCTSDCDDVLQNGQSDNSDSSRRTFREWHEVLETPSYDGEILKILPYVIID